MVKKLEIDHNEKGEIVSPSYVDIVSKINEIIEIISIEKFNKASFVIIQNIKRDNDLIVKARIKLVTVNQEGKPIKIPSIFKQHILIN